MTTQPLINIADEQCNKITGDFEYAGSYFLRSNIRGYAISEKHHPIASFRPAASILDFGGVSVHQAETISRNQYGRADKVVSQHDHYRYD